MLTGEGLEHVSARESDTGLVRVVVDTSKGSRNKYKYDETLGLYRLSKVLPLGITFPYDFGSIPSTRAEDGDPLDVLVLGEEALLPGLCATSPIAGFSSQRREVRKNRPPGHPTYRMAKALGDHSLLGTREMS